MNSILVSPEAFPSTTVNPDVEASSMLPYWTDVIEFHRGVGIAGSDTVTALPFAVKNVRAVPTFVHWVDGPITTGTSTTFQ